MTIMDFVIAGLVGLLVYFISTLVPFLTGIATVVALIAFLLALIGRWQGWYGRRGI